MNQADTAASDQRLLASLAVLVLKDGVTLGGLAADTRALALGLVWCALPPGAALRESEVNASLKNCLADEGRFLAVDHVELRRWLVDGGWLVRDGFGREYRRVAAPDLPADNAMVAAALLAIEPPAWAATVRADDAKQRAVRRQAWEARQPDSAQRTGPA